MDHSVSEAKQKSPFLMHTFGCKVNTYDTGLIQKNLTQSALTRNLELRTKQETESTQVQKLDQPRIHVLNTCAVTAEATKEAVKLIRRLKAKDPFCTVVVTGCAAQVDTKAFEDLPGADLVVANSHKGLLPQIIDRYFKGEVKEKIFKSNIFRKEDLEMGGGVESSHTRSFLKIQDGCNSFCTYCIIPYARGKSRSIQIVELVKRINELYSEGVREVVLTGVHIGDYEDQVLGSRKTLEDLVEAVLLKTKMPRFRLSSLEPVELSDRLLDLYQDRRMCPHFHMSIQSANNSVLVGMKRNYLQKDVIASFEQIAKRVPGAFVGMDVITGFPGETEEHFEDTYKVLAESPWTRIHVFPYSERSGTKAAIMTESVPRAIRMDRSQRLRELSLHRYQSEALKQIGLKKSALVLKSGAKGGNAVTKDYWNIQIAEEQVVGLAGQEVDVIVESFNPNHQRMDGYFEGTLL